MDFRSLPSLVLVVWLSGCTPETAVELQLRLPVADPTARFAFVEVAAAPGQEAPPAVEIPLAADSRRWSCSTILGRAGQPEVRGTVRLCASSPCEASTAGAVELPIAIERPFYDGRRTLVRRTVPSLADGSCEVGGCELDVEACKVVGCIIVGGDGEDIEDVAVCTAGFDSIQHPCETGGSVEYAPVDCYTSE